jgi:hypothetical protein
MGNTRKIWRKLRVWREEVRMMKNLSRRVRGKFLVKVAFGAPGRKISLARW